MTFSHLSSSPSLSLLISLLICSTLLLISSSYRVAADIPVHCIPRQIRDKWMFEILPLPASVAHNPSPATLTQKCSKEYLSKYSDRATFLLMDVMPPNRAYVDEVRTPDSTNNSDDDEAPFTSIQSIRPRQLFNFTMMSDQGFEISNDEFSLFSFFSYEKQPNDYVKSECDRTNVGWFSNKKKDVFGCFIAYKWNSKKEDIVVHKPVSDMISFEDNVHIEKKTEEDDDLSAPFPIDHERIAHINSVQKLWKAHPYPHYKTLSRREMKQKQGVPVRAHSLEEFRTFLRQKREAEEEEDDDVRKPTSLRRKDFRKKFPKRFDWRNHNGESFVSPVRDQGSCGSCFAMATIDALEARIRVQTKNAHKLNLAVQDVISCSPYSQQCNGGYPFSVAKYANDFGVVTEDCLPYKAENGTCAQKCKNPSLRARVSQYGYVGGYLSAGNEEDMMREIYENGPIVGSFMVNDDFKYYENGVYTHVEGKAGHKHSSNPIEFTSHSICIIGWDEDEKTGVKSWIIKNSWGNMFGEEAPKDSPYYKENCEGKEGDCKGFFRLRRGVDESAIESAAVSFIPHLVKEE